MKLSIPSEMRLKRQIEIHPIFFNTLAFFYSCLIPIVFLFSLKKITQPEQILTKGILTISTLLLLTTIGGFLAHYFGISEAYVFEYPNYPYVGDVSRVIGFMNSPNQIAFIGSICILYLIFVKNGLTKYVKGGFIISLLVMLFFTYSKELILLPCALVVTYISIIRKWKIISFILSVFFIFSITILTFFYFSTENDFREDVIEKEVFVDFGDVKVYPTTYYFLWRSSLKMIKEKPLLGVGLGNFDKEIGKHQEQKIYPSNLLIYHAHDNYTGLIAQLGIGFVFVLFLFAQDFRKAFLIEKKDIRYFIISSAYFILYFGFIYNSQNLRFMWMYFGVVSFYIVREEKYFQTNSKPR